MREECILRGEDRFGVPAWLAHLCTRMTDLYRGNGHLPVDSGLEVRSLLPPRIPERLVVDSFT